MPRKPKRGCQYGSCSKLAKDGSQYCEEHKRLMDRQYNLYERSSDYRKRYGPKWHKIRANYVRAHPFCEQCYREGKMIPVEEVHHIIPLSQGGTHDPENLMSLCRSCHNKMHLEIGDRPVRR